MSFLSTLGVQRARFDHAARWALNHFARPDVVVVGEYHGANLGDYLLGDAVATELRNLGHSPVLLTLHNLAREKVFRGVPILMGGGNSLDPDALNLLQRYWSKAGEPSIGGVGLDFVQPNIFRTYEQLFRQFASIYFRSVSQAETARDSISSSANNVVGCSPDLVWILRHKFRELAPHRGQGVGMVAINILPLFLRFDRGKRTVCSIQKDDPFYAQALKESEAYHEVVLDTVGAYQSRGYEVVHIPFDVGDDFLARQWLAPLGVRCLPYTTNISTVIRRMSGCEYFIPTRFHALLCAMAAGVPAKPIPYALKNADLLRHFGFNKWAQQTPDHFCEDTREMKDMLLGHDAVVVTEDAAKQAESEARAAVRSAIGALFGR